MHFLFIISLLCTVSGALATPQRPFFDPIPSPPKLSHLFTARLGVKPNSAPISPGPQGIRLNHAILGGTVKGESVSGLVRPYGGADWTVVDSVSGVASVDARWSFVLPAVVSTGSCEQGAGQEWESVDREVFVRADGPFLPGNTMAQLRMSFETAGTSPSQGVAWMNWVVGLGDLEILNPQNTSLYDVQVDVFIPEGGYAPVVGRI